MVADRTQSTGTPSGRPDLPMAIDTAAITTWLRDRVVWPSGASLESIRLGRFWTSRRDCGTFELALTVASGHSDLSLTLQGGFLPPVSPGRTHDHATITPVGLFGLRLVSTELGLWFCSPDRDRKLRSAAKLMDGPRAAELLEQAGVLGTEAHSSTPLATRAVGSRLVNYRVHRRCVARVWLGDPWCCGAYYLKAFRRPPTADRVAFLVDLAGRVETCSGGRVGLSRIVALLPDERVLVTAEISHGAVPIGSTCEDLAAAAVALVTLHATDAPALLDDHTPAHEVHTVARWLDALPLLGYESRRGELTRLTGALRQRADDLPLASRTLIHRDFHHGQLRRDGDRVWLFDSDTLCVGDAEQDVAVFIAHHVLADLTERRTFEIEATAVNTFLDEYRSHGGRIDADRLGFYLSAALLRLGAIHLARGLPGKLVERMWSGADRLLAERMTLDALAAVAASVSSRQASGQSRMCRPS